MMLNSKSIGKREFIQHTSKYIKWVEEYGNELVITHHNRPDLVLVKIKSKSFEDLRGLVKIKIHGDINESVFPGFDLW